MIKERDSGLGKRYPRMYGKHRSKYTAKRHKRVVGKDRRNRQKQSRMAKRQ